VDEQEARTVQPAQHLQLLYELAPCRWRRSLSARLYAGLGVDDDEVIPMASSRPNAATSTSFMNWMGTGRNVHPVASALLYISHVSIRSENPEAPSAIR
jgi:hypothetical protein